MTSFAVVVHGICDTTTVVVVEDAGDEDDVQLRALEVAKDVPSEKWEHGEIKPCETGDLMELTPTAIKRKATE